MEWKSDASEPAIPRTERVKMNWTQRRNQRGRKRRSWDMWSIVGLLLFLNVLKTEEGFEEVMDVALKRLNVKQIGLTLDYLIQVRLEILDKELEREETRSHMYFHAVHTNCVCHILITS
jgi:hypothetical protein